MDNVQGSRRPREPLVLLAHDGACTESATKEVAKLAFILVNRMGSLSPLALELEPGATGAERGSCTFPGRRRFAAGFTLSSSEHCTRWRGGRSRSSGSRMQRRGSKGKLFQFANPSMQSVMERYMKSCAHSESPENNSAGCSTHGDGDADRVTQFTEKLKSLQSNLIGDNLELLSSRDLIRLEQQIHDSLGRIRAKKEELFLEQLQEIKEKEGWSELFKIATTRRAVTGNSNVLEKIVEFASSELTGSGAGGQDKHACNGAPLMDASLFAEWDSVAQSNPTAECLPVSRMTEDLNKSPPQCEEWSSD
ncbi:hypothetical protein GOP47_0003611 [Adiantum capillus-veneris]|uniref:K-box domain-containing protein n=1 Tax=Adiantum capillus-veneris TaxID=13818 RepID=A0A9D4V698_ADICA|nr:hypothetical protein GOP47_0003611 [Adiantum capillus-veneris]